MMSFYRRASLRDQKQANLALYRSYKEQFVIIQARCQITHKEFVHDINENEPHIKDRAANIKNGQ